MFGCKKKDSISLVAQSLFHEGSLGSTILKEMLLAMYSAGRIDLHSGKTGDSINQLKISRWRAIQRELAQRVLRIDCFVMPPRLVGGVDVAYHGHTAYATAVVLDYETLEMVESTTAESTVENSYIPSFLAFRELKPMIKSIRKLRIAPDILLVDAQGIAHPERCGSASHLGVVLDIPTIGVAKSLLIGEVSDLRKGVIGYLKDKEELIGASIVSRVGSKPVYVSIGHKVSLDSAIKIVGATTKEGNRIPEPLRLAHILANLARSKASK